MEIVYIYRSPKMGISISVDFPPIVNCVSKKYKTKSITFSTGNYSVFSLMKNIYITLRYMKKHKDAVIHITGTENYLIPFLKRYKTVVTVHDLGFYEIMKPGIKKKIKYKLFVESLKYADRVVFISQKSMQEGKKLVAINEEKTSVIYNCVNPAYSPSCFHRFNSEKPVVLQVGTKINNKNLERTAEALKDIPCTFRIIGNLNEERKNNLKKLGIDFIQKENLSEEEMVEEYQSCDIVVFASLYEGFGVPIIEGQACGKPIVTSNIPPMTEVAGDSCVLVDPESVLSIRNGVIEAILNHEKYEKMSKDNVKRFSAESRAEKYISVYKSIID